MEEPEREVLTTLGVNPHGQKRRESVARRAEQKDRKERKTRD
jgi:hypothetical protein